MILVHDASCQTYNANDNRSVAPSKLSKYDANNNLKNRHAASGTNEILDTTENSRNSRSQQDNGREETAEVQPWPPLPQSAVSAVERYSIDDDELSAVGSAGPAGPFNAGVPQQHRWPATGGDSGGPFGPYLQSQLLAGISGGQFLLLRLLFGHNMQTVLQHPIDGYLSFCNRIAAVGRFLNRLFEPLFTAGFYTAASYVFRRSILPRIAHYIHVYTTMNGHHDHDTEARSDDDNNGGGTSLFGDLNAVLTSTAASMMVNSEAINDPPACLRKIVCEIGLAASGNSITHPFRR